MARYMPLLSMDTTRRRGSVKGRECRNQSLNTKLTPTEAAAVEAASRSEGKAVGEWLRDVALRAVANKGNEPLTDALMGEVQALRLILINSLEPLLRGDTMSTEQFKAMLQHVKVNKQKVAADILASYREEGTEQQ